MLQSVSKAFLRTNIPAEASRLLFPVAAEACVQRTPVSVAGHEHHNICFKHSKTRVESAPSWRHYASSAFPDEGQDQKLDKGNGDVRPQPARILDGEAQSYLLMHPRYTTEYVESIRPTHRPPESFVDHAAYYSIQTVRRFFDLVTWYREDNMNRQKWLNRVVFLETIAGVPGIVGGMIRHLNSLRLMRRDNGWIHTLLEEAENERMHLMTFMQLKNPGILFRAAVLVAQGIYCNLFFFSYLVSPTYCHRLVGYLEEEAVKTYTHLLKDIDRGKVPEWASAEAPELAKKYWKLGEDATMRDLVLAVRADEASHSHVNHTFADIGPKAVNPFPSGNNKKL